MKRLIFLGSKRIGKECLDYLLLNREQFKFEIVGVFTNARGQDIRDLCINNSLPVYDDIDLILTLDFDILISVQYDKILKKSHLSKVKELAINLHMAPLPEYRGSNQFSFAIINKDKYFGATIHELTEDIDAGDVLFEVRFEIKENWFVYELYEVTYREALKLFKDHLFDILNGNFERKKQDELLKIRNTQFHYKKEINDLKKINLDWDKEKVERHIRATLMPGFEPPFIEISGKRVYFCLDNNSEFNP